MLVSQDIVPSVMPPEETTALDPAAQISLRERWENGGERFQERAVSAFNQIANRILPEKQTLEIEPKIDLTDGLSIKERWEISGDTFPARVVNSTCRLAHRRTRLDREALECKEYYAGRPRTVRERLARIRTALNPNLLLLELGHVTSDVETGAAEAVRQLRGKSKPSDE